MLLVQGEVARQQQQLLEAQDAQHQVALKDQEIKARFLKSTLYRYRTYSNFTRVLSFDQ